MQNLVKQPKTIEEQINILRGKNLHFDDEQRAIDALSRINYYRLSAYGLTLNQPGKDLYRTFGNRIFKKLGKYYRQTQLLKFSMFHSSDWQGFVPVIVDLFVKF